MLATLAQARQFRQLAEESLLKSRTQVLTIHYGAYETQFLKRMKARFPEAGRASQLDELTSSAQNLLSVIYPHVYFPTYTNGLKEVASYLGYRWSSDSPSGLAALGWRLRWELSREETLKDKLIVYNAEDCAATEKLANALAAICRPESALEGTYPTVNADTLKREYPQRFGDVDFVLPEFRMINKAAYWDYQRSKVYLRTNGRLRRQECKAANRQSMRNVPVRHPPQSGWLDEWGRLKGGRSVR